MISLTFTIYVVRLLQNVVHIVPQTTWTNVAN